jgi:molecular chaperone IbpA
LFRSTIGFDRLTRLVDAATRVDNAAVAYPPCNIETTGEDAYRLTMAVAGFSPAEFDITVQENTLLVTGKARREDENGAAATCIAVSPGARLSGALVLPTTSR